MVISWYGEGCFKIQNGDVVVLTDPPVSASGITAPRLSPDVLIRTISPVSFESEEKDEKTLTIRGAGEYDSKGVKVKGYQLVDESTPSFIKTIYRISWDDIVIGLLGHASSEIPPQLLENFEEIDVLIGPAGGVNFIAQEKMIKLIKQLTPKVFIPSFYKISGLKRKSDDIKEFVSKFGGEVIKDQEKFVFKKKDLEEIKKTKAVCLKV
jgi:L-ascorbate metabolism protein UlaG (beta-lactamase superfamily)